MSLKGDKTKQDIREKAYQLFAEKGFKDVTMKDICELTGLSRGGLYRHYESTGQIYKIIGIIDLRHTLNEFLKDLGNCGYSVRPSERKKGYAAEMLYQLLQVAKEAEMKELHISVEKENAASIKVIQENGGVYERSFSFENEVADIYKIKL